MMGHNDIHWHDCELLSMIEIPSQSELILRVLYPVDWENDKYEEVAIVFSGFHSLAINEIPFEGNPTLLALDSVERVDDDFFESSWLKFNLSTSAGSRVVEAQSVHLRERI
ncbi:hypothetical protein [Vibrio sp. SCSIO 43136]|uniref:hypothetical protein n=1 Tax=Vibrio sp. SCSIO 43136 TaxID=2819101 RepID=UPI00207530F5|nr:hypothetical protein [Vibrio sp. SCSIO 43136]USD64079.1 hypothetical protein J4N39_08065 [Vibrio sp. SCSIO 43136]